jgi:hypothetical protein
MCSLEADDELLLLGGQALAVGGWSCALGTTATNTASVILGLFQQAVPSLKILHLHFAESIASSKFNQKA